MRDSNDSLTCFQQIPKVITIYKCFRDSMASALQKSCTFEHTEVIKVSSNAFSIIVAKQIGKYTRQIFVSSFKTVMEYGRSDAR